MEKQLRLDNKKLYTVNFQIWSEMEDEYKNFEQMTQYRYTSLAENGTDIIEQAEEAVKRTEAGDIGKIVWLDIREG